MKQDSTTKQLNWRDYKEIIVRRRWVLLGPFFALGLAGFIVAHVWPTQFRSQAMVLVDEQKVPDKYVSPNVQSNAATRLQSMTQEILSRTRLQDVINKFGLYPKERARNTMDQLVDKMRQDIQITPVTSRDRPDLLTGFQISYAAPNPNTAQQVVNDLTSLFIQQSIQSRTQQSVSTTDFLESQLDEARKDLTDQEHKLAAYKERYLGELPQQEQGNLQIMSNLQGQLSAATSALDRAQQERAYLESTKTQLQALDTSSTVRDANGNVTVTDPDAELRTLRAKLAALEAEFTPRYPDVISTKEQIAYWENAKKDRDTQRAAASKDPNSNSNDATALTSGDPTRFIDVDSRLKATQLEISDRQKDIKNIQANITQLESRLNVTPLREEELASVTRDTDNARAHYQSLLDKKMQSELATNMEEQQQGEQFRIVDPPTLPQKPTEPNRAEIILGGWLLGLVVSGGLTALGESTDTRLRSEQDLRSTAPVPVLAMIPSVQSPREVRFGMFYRNMEAAGAAVLVLISVGTIIYTYLAG